MKFLTLILFLLITATTEAKFYLQHSIGYNSYTENVQNTKYGHLQNMLFVGASIGGSKRFYFGQSVYIHNFTFNTSDSSSGTMSVTEIGPRFIYFLNDRMTWNISFAWHPYAKGTRTLPTATESTDVTGSAMIASLAYQLPVTKRFYLGASLNYYSYSITEDTTAAGVTSEVSQSYTQIVPMFDISIRFK